MCVCVLESGRQTKFIQATTEKKLGFRDGTGGSDSWMDIQRVDSVVAINSV